MLPHTATDHPADGVSTAAVDVRAASPGTTYPDPPGYDLHEEIGKGGMGVVYRARDHHLKREVAVKVLQDRYAPDSKTAARFVEEAEITAQLQHPGIPAVYHVSKYPDGRPFLAMKLIRGDTLDALLKSNAPINRLAVFEAICHALGYAHSHNVIHRDLKPANVMVGAFGEVQVMDWGLAKVLTVSRETKSSATDTSAEVDSHHDPERSVTQDGSILGTPAYMPPEQAAGEVDKTDRRADVFGLGAILCVLLTGKPPYTGQDSLSVQLKAISGRVEDALAELDHCDAEPGVVELCKQCLSFKPADRPADANALARVVGELRREAEDRARQAELDKAKAEVFAAEQRKRRRVWLGLAAALLIGVVASSGLALWANHARSQADAARGTAERAQREEARARQEAIDERNAKENERKNAAEQAALATSVKNYMLNDLFEFGDPARQASEQAQGLVKMDPDLKVRDLILRAAKRLDGKFPDQPLVEADSRLLLGRTLIGMGEAELACRQFERAAFLYAQKYGPDHLDRIASLNNLAVSYSDLGRSAAAQKILEELVALEVKVLGRDHPDTLKGMNNLAISLYELGRHTEALPLFEDVLAVSSRKLGPDHRDTLRGMNNLAVCYTAMGRNADALTLREGILALCRKKLGPDHPDTLAFMSNLASGYSYAGRTSEALKLNEEALALRRKKLGSEHPDTLSSMNNLAVSYSDLGRPADALKLRLEVLALRKQKHGPDHPNTLTAMSNLAQSYRELGRPVDALKLNEEVLDLRKRILGPSHPDTLTSMNNLANSYAALGRHAEALKLREETLTFRKQKLGPDHTDTLWSMNNLANSYTDLGRHADALKLHEEVLAVRMLKFGPDHPDSLTSMNHVGNSLENLERHADALKVREGALALRRQKLGPDHPETLVSMYNLARSYAALGRHDEALKLRLETLAMRKRKIGPDHPDTLSSLWDIAFQLRTLKRNDEALVYIRDALTLTSQAEANGKRPPPKLVPTMIDFLRQIAMERRDPAVMREAAEEWEKLTGTDGASRYDAACYRALTASYFMDKSEAKVEADKAMAWLKKAVAAGFDKDRGFIENDTDLDALRGRADFKELMESLPTPKAKK